MIMKNRDVSFKYAEELSKYIKHFERVVFDTDSNVDLIPPEVTETWYKKAVITGPDDHDDDSKLVDDE